MLKLRDIPLLLRGPQFPIDFHPEFIRLLERFDHWPIYANSLLTYLWIFIYSWLCLTWRQKVWGGPETHSWLPTYTFLLAQGEDWTHCHTPRKWVLWLLSVPFVHYSFMCTVSPIESLVYLLCSCTKQYTSFSCGSSYIKKTVMLAELLAFLSWAF